MGLQTSKFSTLIPGDILDRRFELYKIKNFRDFEYFKVYDMIEFRDKKALEPVEVKDDETKYLMSLIKELNHPNIMKVDYFIENDHFYVIRSYDDDFYGFAWRLQIQRLLESYKKHIEIEEDQIVYWIKQLLQAVECLHDNSVLHLFVTPQTMSFEGTQLKLFIPSRSIVLQQPDEKIDVGRTWYRCPENEKNNVVDTKYDIWSIGWTLYNLCSLDDSRFVLDEVEDFEKWLWPDLPRHYTRNLDKIFKMMTHIDPERRPTAMEMLRDPIFKPFENK